mmetsp:Transcript_87403/g.248073  ORF Transcript_87403/g.248073 Transcript_87403/m.248073 type:complete len:421 (-) Transcript_87403:2085-3347(-)
MRSDGDCVECVNDDVPTGALTCRKGSTLAALKVNEGFWRFDENSSAVYACYHSGNCIGGNVTGAQLCSEGAGGPTCSVWSVWGSVGTPGQRPLPPLPPPPSLTTHRHHHHHRPPNYFSDAGYYMRYNTPRPYCESCKKGPIDTAAYIILASVVVLLGCGTAYWIKHRHAINEWRRENRDDIQLMADVTTILWVCIQTVVLITANHSASGGADPPSLYATFLSGFEFLTLDILTALPGTDCLYRGYAYSLLGNTLLFIAFAAACVGYWWHLKHNKKSPEAWRVLKKLVWVGKLVSLGIEWHPRPNIHYHFYGYTSAPTIPSHRHRYKPALTNATAITNATAAATAMPVPARNLLEHQSGFQLHAVRQRPPENVPHGRPKYIVHERRVPRAVLVRLCDGGDLSCGAAGDLPISAARPAAPPR